jgi:SAM-dependent methyltransferase
VLSRYAAVQARILDAGCGTGLAGQILAARGYRNVEGLDLSAGMLREAGKKARYAALHQQTLGEPLRPNGGRARRCVECRRVCPRSCPEPFVRGNDPHHEARRS